MNVMIRSSVLKESERVAYVCVLDEINNELAEIQRGAGVFC